MCVYSMIAQDWNHRYPYPPNPLIPSTPAPYTWPPLPTTPACPPTAPYDGPTREQFEELLQLLRQAKKYDESTGHKECGDDNNKSINWGEKFTLDGKPVTGSDILKRFFK